MNKYLITGGSGFIGTNLINYIRKREPDALLVAVANAETINPVEGCKYIISNIRNTENYERFLDGNMTVIHLAWSGFPNIKISSVFDGINNNITSSCRLFETAINRNCKSIIFLSSGGGIYGKPLSIPISEQHPTTPLSYYGIEKLTVENYLRLMTSNTNTKAVILRPSNPYGRFQRPFTGQGVIATFLAAALIGKPVEVWGDGTAVRDYFYIDALSDAIYRASSTREKCIIANIGSSVGSSINNIIETISLVTGKKLDVKYVETTSAETGANILDCSVAKEKFGWEAKYSLEEGIRLMYSTWNPYTEQFDGRLSYEKSLANRDY